MHRIFGFHEIRTAKFIKAFLSEFLATAILIISGCGSGLTMDSGKPLSTLTTSLTFSMTVAFLVYTFNQSSGAHLNPVVTLGFLVTGHTTVAKTIAYALAQCGGAITGAAVLWCMVPPSWRGTLGSTVFAEGVTVGQGFALEALSTFLLMLGVFASGDAQRTDHGGSTSLTIGLIVFMQSTWVGKTTGCSMNPARTLGPAVLSGIWDNHWVYWVAPTLGSVLGSLFYQHILTEPLPEPANNIQAVDVARSPTTDPEKQRLNRQMSPVVENISTIRSLKEGFSNPVLSMEGS